MAKKIHNPVPVHEVPEVAAFEEVKARMEAFQQNNPQFFEYLGELAEEYNDRLEAAINATRSRGISCGDIVLYQFGTTYDWEALYQALGHQEFLNVGGKVRQIASYDGDKKHLDSAFSAGRVSADLYNRVVKKTPRFKKPSKVLVP